MRPPLVVITDSNLPSERAEEQVLAPAGFKVVRANCRTEAEVIDAGADADALIVQWAPISEAVIERLTRCRLISRLGIGWDMIDLEAATRQGIAVANTPEYCVEEVAAHSIALALAASRGLLDLDRSLRSGEWSVAANTPLVRRPSSAVFAVVGFGRIGRRVAEIARAIGFAVVVYDPNIASGDVIGQGFRAASLHDALLEATIVSLHLPLTSETRRMIDAEALELMGEGSFLINTSRGELIDEPALAAALRSGTLAGAALDVFELEPLPSDSLLRQAPNLLLTPHAAWYSNEALAELPLLAAQNVIDFFSGSSPVGMLNPGYADVSEARAASSVTGER